ncbi:MAG TPA: hypothetical protein PKY87_12635 [Terricaulis sp.]|nr:hypothetical protein [Terricaulis sp.]
MIEARQILLKSLKYRAQDERVLRRLASALVLQWDELSDEFQDLIIDQAAMVEDREPEPVSVEEIEAFVRSVKTTAIVKPRQDGEVPGQ